MSTSDQNQHNLPHGGATEGVSQADEGLGLRPAVDSEWSAGGAIPPAANQHAATLLAFVNETNEERIPSYDQVEAAVHGLVEQLKAERDARKGAMRDMGRAQSEAVEVLRELAELKEQVKTLRELNDRVIGERDTYEHDLMRLGEQLEALRTAAQEYRTLISPLYEGEEWEAAEALDAALASSPAIERGEDPGEDIREPDPPGLRESQREIMETHGYEMPDWKPDVPSPASEPEAS